MTHDPRDADRAGRLSLAVTHADGSVTRWGSDELDATDIPSGLTFTTTIPGGFGDLSCSLLRRIDIPRADEQELDTITALGPGNEIAWEGRLVQFPRKHGDSFTVEPGGEGWVAHLRDDTSFREIYVDRDLSKWGDPHNQRQVNLITAGYDTSNTAASVTADASTPALRGTLRGVTTANRKPISEAWYDAGDIPIGLIGYAWNASGAINTANTSYHWSVGLSSDDQALSIDGSGELRAVGPGLSTLSATALRTFALVQFYFDTSFGLDGSVWLNWTCLAIYGTHGLTLRGVVDATTPQGVYASDVIADVISRAAPLLNYTTGPDGSISPTSIVINQLTFTDPTTAEDPVKKCNATHLYDWGVYDRREFFFRAPDPDRLTWTCRIDEGAAPDLDGPAASDLINGVIVTYTDPSGRSGCVGPSGTPNMTATDPSLGDTSDMNQVNAHGIPRKTVTLSLSDVADVDFAITVGGIFLAERGGPQRRGQVTLTGFAEHPTAGSRPVWAIRAGDFIDITDTNDNSLGGPRRIIQTSYDHDARANQLTLDNTAYTLDALLEILGAELTNIN